MRLFELFGETDISEDENMRKPVIATKTVAIYPGRFHPFHAGHYSVYKRLVNIFGKDNVYIVTSNKNDSDSIQQAQEKVNTYLLKVAKYNDDLQKFKNGDLKKKPKLPKQIPIIPKFESPFNFDEKKLIMTSMYNIPDDKIIQIRNPYKITEEPFFERNFSEDTAIVYALSSKDANRLTFDEYKPNQILYGYKDIIYQIIVPEYVQDINGKNISGTRLRELLSDVSSPDDVKELIFKRAYNLPLDEDLSSKAKMVFELIKNKIGTNQQLINDLYSSLDKDKGDG